MLSLKIKACVAHYYSLQEKGSLKFRFRASLLEENARANPDARIHPLTHISVDRAYQAESVGSNSLLSTLICYLSLSNL